MEFFVSDKLDIKFEKDTKCTEIDFPCSRHSLPNNNEVNKDLYMRTESVLCVISMPNVNKRIYVNDGK